MDTFRATLGRFDQAKPWSTVRNQRCDTSPRASSELPLAEIPALPLARIQAAAGPAAAGAPLARWQVP
jgi:hypothetical protein